MKWKVCFCCLAFCCTFGEYENLCDWYHNQIDDNIVQHTSRQDSLCSQTSWARHQKSNKKSDGEKVKLRQENANLGKTMNLLVIYKAKKRIQTNRWFVSNKNKVTQCNRLSFMFKFCKYPRFSIVSCALRYVYWFSALCIAARTIVFIYKWKIVVEIVTIIWLTRSHFHYLRWAVTSITISTNHIIPKEKKRALFIEKL